MTGTDAQSLSDPSDPSDRPSGRSFGGSADDSSGSSGDSSARSPGGSSGDPADGPLSLEILADLHAGVLDEPLATRLRQRIATDPTARTVLAALDATVADLVTWPQRQPVRMPENVALRLDAALAAEARRGDRAPHAPEVWSVPDAMAAPDAAAAPEAPPPLAVDLTARRRRRIGWIGAGLLTAAAAAMGVLMLAGLQWEIAGIPQASEAIGTAPGVHPAPPLALSRTNLGSALDKARSSRDFGPLSSPAKLRHCLAANGVGEHSEPIGALAVTLDGQPGILIVLSTGRLAEFQLLVVGPQCSPGNPSQLANSLVPGR